jgi:hypothetical protein
MATSGGGSGLAGSSCFSLVPLPDLSAKMSKRPEGMSKRPEGMSKRPEGMSKRPEGMSKRPEGSPGA